MGGVLLFPSAVYWIGLSLLFEMNADCEMGA